MGDAAVTMIFLTLVLPLSQPPQSAEKPAIGCSTLSTASPSTIVATDRSVPGTVAIIEIRMLGETTCQCPIIVVVIGPRPIVHLPPLCLLPVDMMMVCRNRRLSNSFTVTSAIRLLGWNKAP